MSKNLKETIQFMLSTGEKPAEKCYDDEYMVFLKCWEAYALFFNFQRHVCEEQSRAEAEKFFADDIDKVVEAFATWYEQSAVIHLYQIPQRTLEYIFVAYKPYTYSIYLNHFENEYFVPTIELSNFLEGYYDNTRYLLLREEYGIDLDDDNHKPIPISEDKLDKETLLNMNDIGFYEHVQGVEYEGSWFKPIIIKPRNFFSA